MSVEEFKPVELDANEEVLARIRQFEEELSEELGEHVSVVAYSSEGNVHE